ncbi:hypothetical protein Cgig2_020428 [Carnegiea gigantea]|uniref:Uncharacterized protein n=1 Tax=Carnegiea gigantea TaxID=171969 RepID=A0A9Q1Q8Y2_9CARY|nr:hypothetical protein Cgig2_020428 [Carnegiea gigantea]
MQKNAEEAVEQLKAEGIQVSGVVCHVSNARHRINLIQHAVQKYGKIDVIVSNAGVNPVPGPVLDTPESALDKLWDVNVKASILLLRVILFHPSHSSTSIATSIRSTMAPKRKTPKSISTTPKPRKTIAKTGPVRWSAWISVRPTTTPLLTAGEHFTISDSSSDTAQPPPSPLVSSLNSNIRWAADNFTTASTPPSVLGRSPTVTPPA